MDFVLVYIECAAKGKYTFIIVSSVVFIIKVDWG